MNSLMSAPKVAKQTNIQYVTDTVCIARFGPRWLVCLPVGFEHFSKANVIGLPACLHAGMDVGCADRIDLRDVSRLTTIKAA